MIDQKEMYQEYIKSYMDRSRIYFIEKYLSTFNADERKTVPFILFPRQKAFCHSLAENNNTIAIKHRQAGITTVSAGWITPQLVFAKSDSPETVLCIGNKLDLACQMVEKIKAFLLQVPRWFWGEDFYSPDPKSEKNLKSIFTKETKDTLFLFNGSKVYARSSGENAARGISSVSILIFDEAAFIEKGDMVYASAVAATSAVKNAKIIMVSTPNGKDPLYYRTYQQALERRNNYNAVEFKWFQDLRYNKFLRWYRKNAKTGKVDEIIEKTLDETGRIEYNEEKWRQLEKEGWTPSSPWKTKMEQAFNNDSMRIAQEIEVSFMGSADNVIDPEVIDRQRLENVCDPLEDYGDPAEENTWFWKRPIEGHRYILAADPSKGSASDRTSIQVIDLDGRDDNGFPILEQIMEYNGRVLGDKLGDMLYRYGTLFNNALVVVDGTGGVGDAALLRLMNYYNYKNLFYDDKVAKDYMKMVNKPFAEQYADRMPGFHFQGNRFAMLNNFATMVRQNEFHIHSVRLLNELDTWIFKGEDGRMDHITSAHDDNITCAAMALFVLRFSFQKMEATKSRDAAILNGYMMGGGYKVGTNHLKSDKPITPGNGLPFYNDKSLKKYNGSQGSCMWLFAGYMNR